MNDIDDDDYINQLLGLILSGRVFTDLMIEEDMPPMAKGPGGWAPVETIVAATRADIVSVLEKLTPDWEKLLEERAINRPIDLTDWRLRINAYLGFGGKKLMMSIRKQSAKPPALANTGLPASVRLMIDQPRGLILIGGATGSGKSTSLASLVDAINETRGGHVVTIEDPIEYLFARKKAIFSQREVGVDVGSFFEGVRDAMRQAPDVIVIGEIRDKDTAETALLAAESGHLVIGTVHANTASGAVQKLLAFFPSHERNARLQTLSSTLVGVLSQMLLPSLDRSGWVLASELLFNHKQQFSKVLDSQDKIDASLERSEDDVSRTMTTSLIELVEKKLVSKADAIRSLAGGSAGLYERFKALDDKQKA